MISQLLSEFPSYVQELAASRKRAQQCIHQSRRVFESVRAVCVSLGVVLIDPIHLTLSVILWTAARPGADMRLREPLLQDVVRLGERALLALRHGGFLQPDQHSYRL